jgi:hypothetical protein
VSVWAKFSCQFPPYRLDAAKFVDLAPGVGGRMELRHRRPDPVEQRGRGGVFTHEPIEHALGGKPPHHHRDLEGAAPAVEARRPRATLDATDEPFDLLLVHVLLLSPLTS